MIPSMLKPPGVELETNPYPTFAMRGCTVRGNHFHKGYRWYCKHCRKLLRSDYETVCFVLWNCQRTLSKIAGAKDTSPEVLSSIAREGLKISSLERRG